MGEAWSWRVAVGAAALAAVACSGEIGVPNGGSPVGGAGGPGVTSGGSAGVSGGGGTPAAGTSSTGGSSAGGAPAQGGAAPGGSGTTACKSVIPPAGLVVLPDFQVSNAIRGLFGDAAVAETAPEQHTKSFTTKGVVINTSVVDTRLNWGALAASSFAASFSEVTGCPSNGDDACAQTYLEALATRAFRRPLVAQELVDLMAVYQVGKTTSFQRGVELGVHAILGSPSFTYRTEFGTPGADGSRALTAHELASELGFLLTDALPDPDLRAAADAGTLLDPAVLRAEVDRMLRTPSVQDSLTSTLMAAWGFGNLFGATKDTGTFPDYTPLLQSSMHEETRLFLLDTLFQSGGPISQVLTSTKTFVNEPLAQFYGIPFTGTPGSTAFVAATLPATERAGLLTQPSLMAARARTDNTSVVARGLFVRGPLLCLSKIMSPPEELSGRIQEQLAANLTERQRSDERRGDIICSGCHAQFDPFGLLFENYDAIGRYRSMLNGQAIDASMDLTGLTSFGRPIANAVELAQAVSTSPELKSCLVQELLAYGTGEETFSAETCEVQAAVAGLPSADPTLAQIVGQVTASRAFTARNSGAAQ